MRDPTVDLAASELTGIALCERDLQELSDAIDVNFAKLLSLPPRTVRSSVRRPRAARKASIRSLVARPPDGLQDPAGEPGLLMIDQAAAYLGITDDQVAAFVADGELSYINLGRGKKRARYRFTIPDLQAFIEHRRRREVFCRSTSPKSRRSTTSTARSEVVGFMAARAAQLGKKPKPTKR